MPRRRSLIVLTVESNDPFKAAIPLPEIPDFSREEFVHEGNNGSFESSVRKSGL
jgi:hypothetical protein